MTAAGFASSSAPEENYKDGRGAGVVVLVAIMLFLYDCGFWR